MANPLPPVPQSSPMVDSSGMVTQKWVGFLNELYSRVGGTRSSSNSQLLALIETLQGRCTALETAVDGLGQGPVL